MKRATSGHTRAVHVSANADVVRVVQVTHADARFQRVRPTFARCSCARPCLTVPEECSVVDDLMGSARYVCECPR